MQKKTVFWVKNVNIKKKQKESIISFQRVKIMMFLTK